MTALLIAFVGELILASGVGSILWLELFIGVTFAIYALIRKQIRGTDALSGLVVELILLVPIALAIPVFWYGRAAFFFDGGIIATVLGISSGIVTETPLMLFHIGNRYLPLTLTRFPLLIDPSIQLFRVVWLKDEPLGLTSVLVFGFIWSALLVQSVRLSHQTN